MLVSGQGHLKNNYLYGRMKRNSLMGFRHHLAFIPLVLVVIFVVTCDSGQTERHEGWDVRLEAIDSRCSGWLEILHEGKWKRISTEKWTPESSELACKQLHCGFPIGILKPYSPEPEKQEICQIECMGNETTLNDCIWDEPNNTYHPSVALVCQDPVQTSTVSQPTTIPLVTSKSTVQDCKPCISNMEAVLRKLLGLALTTVILLICVPPIYRRVRKKYSKKEQQWIGPHGTNQSVSFHRNNSVAFQPHPQKVIQREETDAIKKKSYLSPYSALEGTNNRISSPLDNSSDSDYDLSSAQQL